MGTPTIAELARAFDLVTISESSLSPWASVHRACSSDGRDVVVKRTASKPERALAMADWTRAVRACGPPVVTPVELGPQNPQQVGDDWWVVYPFIAGRGFTAGDLDHLQAAGDHLGRLHSAQVDPSILARLRPYDWPETTREDVDGDLHTLHGIFASRLGATARSASTMLTDLADRWYSESLPALRQADNTDPLPRSGVSSDYKAANLIYGGDGYPTLVDPDNGGLEPRLFDLAMAVVLFHNECATAPGRLFTSGEWEIFASAYLRHMALTPRERLLWPAALDHMLWEEGSWALEDNDADAWADARQGSYLEDLAMTTPDRYPLPG